MLRDVELHRMKRWRLKVNDDLFLMRRLSSFTFVGWWLVLSGAGCLFATPVPAARPSLVAVPTTEPITVDGVLDEAAWQHVEVIDTLRQREPNEGQAASEPTQVRVVYSPTHLYVGVQCVDSEPQAIVATRFDRDAELEADDRISLLLDTFHDRRNAFIFQVNAVGARFDQIISDEGQDRNPDWNGIWYARTRITEQGWTVEFSIPFQTLNFRPDHSTWGFNVQRIIKRRNEEAVWAGYRQNLNFFRVSEAGTLTGLGGLSQELGIAFQLDVVPSWSLIPRRKATNFQPSLDVFYKLTPSLTLSLSLNTDFGETEVDDAQVNLTRFSLFFPEKRQFFLEDAGNFTVDGLTPTSGPLVIIPFFSRRIGISDDGKTVDVVGGGKLSGRTGPYRIGMMSVQTQNRGRVPGENFSIVRVKRNILTKSSIGFLATRRTPERGPATGLAGSDFRYSTSELGGDKNLEFSSFFLRSFRPGTTKNLAWGSQISLPNDTWRIFGTYREVQKEFEATMGFVPRTGIRRFGWFVQYAPRPELWQTRQVSCAFDGNYFADPDTGTLLTRNVNFPCEWRFESGDVIRFRTIQTFERLHDSFPISDGVTIPAGDYVFRRQRIEFDSADKRKVEIFVRYQWGQFFSGRRDDWIGRLAFRPGPFVFFSGEYQQNDVRLPWGSFVVRLIRARLNLALNPDVSWFAFGQYDTVSDTLGLNTQLRWIIEPGNELFVVYHHNWLIRDGDIHATVREGRIKVRYTYRF